MNESIKVRTTHRVSLRKAKEGGYVVFAFGKRGCASQGETKREALANIAEAIALWIESGPPNSVGDDEGKFTPAFDAEIAEAKANRANGAPARVRNQFQGMKPKPMRK